MGDVKPAARVFLLTPLGHLMADGIPGTCRDCGAVLRYLPLARQWVAGPDRHEQHRCWVDGAQ